MGGWAKLALGVLVAALVAVLIVSFTSDDDSTSSGTATVADGQSSDAGDAKAGDGKGADGESKQGGAKGDGGNANKPAESAAPVEGEAGFTGSSGGSEEQSGGDSGSNKGSEGGKAGGLGNATSQGSKKSGKKKKKSKKKSKAASGDPERDAASAVLVAYMSARAAADWPTACAQLAPQGIKSLERFAGPGRGCVATFTAIYPRLAPGTWANTMTGPITILRPDGVAIYHGSTGKDYAMPMVKEGGAWKVAALGPTAIS